jgi:hypothetical protein
MTERSGVDKQSAGFLFGFFVLAATAIGFIVIGALGLAADEIKIDSRLLSLNLRGAPAILSSVGFVGMGLSTAWILYLVCNLPISELASRLCTAAFMVSVLITYSGKLF